MVVRVYLVNPGDLLQVTTGSAGDIEVRADYVDYASPTTVTAGRVNTASITTAATTTVVGAPGSGAIRNVVKLSIYNAHATVSNVVGVVHTDGVNPVKIRSVTLAPGESLDYDGHLWVPYNANGSPRTGVTVLAGGSSTADQTANAADTYLAGSSLPVTGRVQAGTVLRWVVTATKTAAGAATPIWNIRVGTAGTTADTSRGTLTGLAQTAAADTGFFVVEANFRAVGASAVLQSSYTATHRLAATGFINQAIDASQAVSATFDVTTAGLVIGLSVNPGTSGVWTVKNVSVVAANLL